MSERIIISTVPLLPLWNSLTREMRQSLDELGVLKQTKATSALSVAHQHSSAAARKGTSFSESVVLVGGHDELQNWCSRTIETSEPLQVN
jgi:hypothetical protein